MDHHARILQQRVQVAAVERGREEALERVGGEQRESEEAGADQAHDAEHARRDLVGQLARAQGDGEGPAG